MLRVRPRLFAFLVSRVLRPANLVSALPATPSVTLPSVSLRGVRRPGHFVPDLPPARDRAAATLIPVKSSLTLLLLFIEGHGQAP